MWSVTGAIPIKVEVPNHSEYLVSMPVELDGNDQDRDGTASRGKTFTIGVSDDGNA